MAPALDMDAVAALCGYSWERFRKVWRQLPGFPAPVKRPSLSGRGTYAWQADSVRTWLDARERAFGPGGAQLQAPANDPAPQRAHLSAVDRQRAQIRKLMARG